MKKLQKLSKNKKPAFVLIYGPIASGKLTIARELVKKTGYRNLHNHLVIDICLDIFGKDDEVRPIFREKLYFQMINLLAELKVSTVLTHAFASNFVFKSGMTDPEYIQKTEKIITRNGGLFYGVHLVCDEKELLRRVNLKSRKEFHKLKDVKIAKEILSKYDHATSAPIKNNFIIDNTNLSPKKVVDMIIEHFKLK